MGNMLIIVILVVDSRLHTAMYFFIGNLSVVEIWYTTVTVPKMLANFMTEKRTISIPGCITQYYFFFAFAAIELFILTVMAYDRYLAICNPLRYSAIMNPKTCRNMAVMCWFVGFICPTFSSVMLSKISFCMPNRINHFFCDAGQILSLTCTNTYIIQIIGYGLSSVIVMATLLFTVSSYVQIIITILKMSSAAARKKTFSTCASHLSVVTIYYGTLIFMYVRPAVKYNANFQCNSWAQGDHSWHWIYHKTFFPIEMIKSAIFHMTQSCILRFVVFIFPHSHPTQKWIIVYVISPNKSLLQQHVLSACHFTQIIGIMGNDTGLNPVYSHIDSSAGFCCY